MTDPDALALRAMIAKYGLRSVIVEVTQVTTTYAERDTRYYPVRLHLGRLWKALRVVDHGFLPAERDRAGKFIKQELRSQTADD